MTLTKPKKVIHMEAKPSEVDPADQLKTIDRLLAAELANLERKAFMTAGLDAREFEKLNKIVAMRLQLSKINLNNTQTDILEGKSDEEIIDMVEQAKLTLLKK